MVLQKSGPLQNLLELSRAEIFYQFKIVCCKMVMYVEYMLVFRLHQLCHCLFYLLTLISFHLPNLFMKWSALRIFPRILLTLIFSSTISVQNDLYDDHNDLFMLTPPYRYLSFILKKIVPTKTILAPLKLSKDIELHMDWTDILVGRQLANTQKILTAAYENKSYRRGKVTS